MNAHSRLAAVTFLLMIAASLITSPARAVIEIEITRGGDNAIPIAVVPFGGVPLGDGSADIAAIVAADLQRSGNFSPLNREDLVATPVSGERPRFANWRLTGADFLLVGAVRPDDDGFAVEFQLFDVVQQSLMIGYRFPVTDQTFRSVAHRIADEVYEEILGVPGAFNTQIAFVSAEGVTGNRTYRLELSDADGEGAREMLKSPTPILSPAWAPDGVRIAYVSFEDRTRSAIYIQDRERGVREKVVSRDGINGAPSFSPDGERLALTLSETGSPDIHVLDIASGRMTQVTDNAAIDTEPTWLDDETIVFTSDRSGGPQIYEVSARGGRAKRLTFDGRYNASPTVSPDGETVAFVHGVDGRFQIATVERDSGVFRTLTQGTLDESPTFSPNGQMILYATEKDGRGTLGAVSLDGSVVQSLTLADGDFREPAWSPYVE